jgi:hypothetical protein
LAVGTASSTTAITASEEAKNVSKRPWWVESVDRPVLEIDDNVYNRFDQHRTVLNAIREYVSPERYVEVVVRMSPELADLGPSPLCDATTSLGYNRLEFTPGLLAAFIRNLGYIAIPSVNGMKSSIPFAVDAGLGEVGRTNRFVSPIFGPAVQLGKVLTDMPMAVDKPIHFGLVLYFWRCRRSKGASS